jgi:5-methylcytosine-specific restriction enzyme subunit McrC
MTEVSLYEWRSTRLPRTTFDAAAQRALADLPSTAFRIRAIGDDLELCARAHVGRVQLGALTVTVLPKLADHTLLRLLAYTYGLGDLRLFQKTDYTSGALLQDLLCEQLRHLVAAILDHGLERRYRRVALELAAPRGRLDLTALAGRMPLTRATLPCIDHTRSIDHPLHQVLLAGLLLARRIARDPELRARLRDLAARLAEGVTQVPLTRIRLDAARRGLHRLVEHYRPALRLVELLHASGGFEVNGHNDPLTAPGFLFDMNRFFQALVLQFLREHLPGCEVEAERSLHGLYQWTTPSLPGRRAPLPRPDFTVTEASRTVLLDAKYRDLSRTPLPREMLYQLTVYAMSRGPGGTAAIIYPVAESPALPEERLDLHDPHTTGPRATVFLRPLPLAELADNLALGDAGRTGRIATARTLAFGPAVTPG